jgi:hypothetical protein
MYGTDRNMMYVLFSSSISTNEATSVPSMETPGRLRDDHSRGCVHLAEYILVVLQYMYIEVLNTPGGTCVHVLHLRWDCLQREGAKCWSVKRSKEPVSIFVLRQFSFETVSQPVAASQPTQQSYDS